MNDDIIKFDWKDYVKLAEDISTIGDNEANYRTAISRAYYGTFCHARNKKALTSEEHENIHWKVINTLKESRNKNEKFAGILMDSLRRNRNKADYDDEYRIGSSIAKKSIKKAKYILELLDIDKV